MQKDMEEEIEEEEIEEVQDQGPLNAVQNQLNQVRRKMAESAARFETKNRCTTGTIILMLSVSGLYDLVQAGLNFIPFLGWILSFFVGIYAWLTFYVWTSILGWNVADTAIKGGVNFLKGALKATKFFARYIAPIIALIPVVNSLPEITAGVLLSILIIKAQDTLYNVTKGKVDENVIMEGIAFFDLFRNIYSNKWTEASRYTGKRDGGRREGKSRFKEEEGKESRNRNDVVGGDALDSLNNKENRTAEEEMKLTRARYIMQNHNISGGDQTDPVYRAAWKKVQSGVELYSPLTGEGYKFNNTHYG